MKEEDELMDAEGEETGGEEELINKEEEVVGERMGRKRRGRSDGRGNGKG